MRPNIVFLDRYTASDRSLERIEKLGNYTEYSFTEPHEVIERCKDADVIICNKTIIDSEKMAQLPRLRLICIFATGMNNVDLNAAAEAGISVRNAAGYSTESVSESTIGAAISLLRQSLYYDNFVKSGAYAASGRQFHQERPIYRLHGANWGVIGLGNIGRNVARLAQAFGCNVRYYSTSGAVREEIYPASSLEELLSWADIISVHCPLSEKTHNLIDAEQFAQMKPRSVIVNVARGGIINEKALAEALDSGTIAGAALDVFSHEPIESDNPLLSIKEQDRLLLSPHTAWQAAESLDTLIGCVATNIEEFYAEHN